VTRTTRRLMAGAIVALIPVLAGCEAGLNAPTSEFHPAANGAYNTTGDVAINNAFVLGAPMGQTLPAGSDAGLFLALYSTSPNGDQLTSVNATGVAASVKLTDGPVSIPGSTSVNLTGPSPEIVLTDLKEPLSAGQDISLEFTFANSGTVALQVTLQVPVQPQANAYATYVQPPSPAPSPPATAAATASPTTTASTTATHHKKHAHASATASPSVSASPTPSVTP
jgi:copper(I)-binding protein